MHETKALLIRENGLRCMLCGKEIPYYEINWHHIIPKFVFRQQKQPVDNSYENGSLLCVSCHTYVHSLDYPSCEYTQAMETVKRNKKKRQA